MLAFSLPRAHLPCGFISRGLIFPPSSKEADKNCSFQALRHEHTCTCLFKARLTYPGEKKLEAAWKAQLVWHSATHLRGERDRQGNHCLCCLIASSAPCQQEHLRAGLCGPKCLSACPVSGDVVGRDRTATGKSKQFAVSLLPRKKGHLQQRAVPSPSAAREIICFGIFHASVTESCSFLETTAQHKHMQRPGGSLSYCILIALTCWEA